MVALEGIDDSREKATFTKGALACPTSPLLSDYYPMSGDQNPPDCWLIGGSKKDNFLVSCAGLTQPHARRGLVAFKPACSQHTIKYKVKCYHFYT